MLLRRAYYTTQYMKKDVMLHRQPAAHRASSLSWAQRVILIAIVSVMVLLAGGVAYEGRRLEGHTAPTAASSPLASPQPTTTGQRWFWRRSQWQQPDQSQP